MDEMEGKVALVTGASSGIGRAAALKFAAQGARVALVARRADRLDEVAHAIAATDFLSRFAQSRLDHRRVLPDRRRSPSDVRAVRRRRTASRDERRKTKDG